ncbi:hypothetical protein DAY19_14330 [Halobacteriovorax vibrionivorans]|uniref:Uncharacterized protein n=1 Tax=Halobacteriovorax vibrionivorans TaxID=2152716 RepID=A0ABY0IH40_9BACT|nr:MULTISPECIES: hypothetical protein [Halobacteriovorax]RZF21151.1 hypothetical protein DAY19_14330 [Halobacteriovorax vibrionivorans]TGD46252.1 hypothetical protein EP118_12685 [Halobacteriovorax sp. Y22]
MGTSCIKEGGYVYKKYELNQCPPLEYILPLHNGTNASRVELSEMPDWNCVRLSSYQYFKNNNRIGPLYAPILQREKDKCFLYVGFRALFPDQVGGIKADTTDPTKAYTYPIGVQNIDAFTNALLNGTKMLPVMAGEVKTSKSDKEDLEFWCKTLNGDNK